MYTPCVICVTATASRDLFQCTVRRRCCKCCKCCKTPSLSIAVAVSVTGSRSNESSDGFATVGYEKSTAAFGGIGRLLLAARKGNDLVYVGGVGTGFNERSASDLREQMDRLVIAKPAVDTGRKHNAVFFRPPRACCRDRILPGRMMKSCAMRLTRASGRSGIMPGSLIWTTLATRSPRNPCMP